MAEPRLSFIATPSILPDSAGMMFEPTADLPFPPDAGRQAMAFTTVELEADSSPATKKTSTSAAKPHAPVEASPVIASLPVAIEVSVPGPGTVLRSRYQIERQIGVGGTSLVFRAVDLVRLNAGSPDPFVAVKLLRPEYRGNEVAETRLKREFVRLEALGHQFVARALDLDRDTWGWFVVLELLEGMSLATRLESLGGKPMPRAEALRLITACGQALHAAHSRDQLHLDFKPANVFLTQTDEIRILDLGAGHDAYTTSAPLALMVPQQATPTYASPEILAGALPDVRDDVFSFGVVVYELLTGRPPNPAQLDSLRARHHTPRPAGVSRRQWDVVIRALARRREARPASAMEIVTAFQPSGPRQHIRTGAFCVAAAVGGFLTAQWFANDVSPSAPSTLPVNPAPIPSIASVFDTSDDGWFEMAPLSPPVDAPEQLPARVVATPINPPQPAFIVSDQETIIVERPTLMAAIILRREAGEGQARAARIQWQTLPGTATAGIDYVPVDSGEVRFADNQDISALYVRLLSPPNVTGDRTFFVALSSTTPNVAIHETSVRIPVVIRD